MQKINVQRLFYVACGLKVASAFAGWYFRSPLILGFIFPIAVMLAYILIGTYCRNDDVSKEKFADSCYYLGFIFTVTSISVALIDLPNIALQIQDIAVRFGAAMMSTVLGLAVRVGMVTFQKDLNDAIRHAEEGVVEASIKFRDHLGFALERLQSFETAVDQASQLSVERVSLNIERLSTHHADRLSAFFDELTRGNRDAFAAASAELKTASQRLSESVDGYAQGMRANLGSIEAKVNAFTDAVASRLAATTFPDDYFSRQLESPLEQLRAASNSVHLEVLDASKIMGESNTDLSAAMKKLRNRAVSAEASLDSVSKLAIQQQALFDATQGHLNAIDRVGATLSGVDAALATVVRELGAGSARTTDVRDTLAQLLEDGTIARHEVTSALEALVGDLSRFSAENQQYFGQAQQTFDAGVKAYDALSQRVDASHEIMAARFLEGADATLKAAERLSLSAAVTESAADKLQEVAASDAQVAHRLQTIGDVAGAGLERFDVAVQNLQTMVVKLDELRETLQPSTPMLGKQERS